jgi:hypothetical protein
MLSTEFGEHKATTVGASCQQVKNQATSKTIRDDTAMEKIKTTPTASAVGFFVFYEFL